jgi:hypothetical protein
MKEAEMGGTHSINEREDKLIRSFVGKSWKKETNRKT